jgi:DNA-3-methyladenine glycosylase II
MGVHKQGKLPTRIKRRADLERAVAYLASIDPHLSRAVDEAGPVGFKMRPAGFASLLKIIVEQQLSTASAWAIWSRLIEPVDAPIPDYILSLSDAKLRKVGLSAPKMRYCRALAEAVTCGQLDLASLSRLPDEKAMEALQCVKGVGRWTAEIYLLFCLGRPDVWPAGDIAVQSALQFVQGLKERPDPLEMDELAERWRPLRGVAALILWNYYRHVKRRPLWE